MLRTLVAAGLLLALVAVAAPPAGAVSATVCAPPNVDCIDVDPGIGQVIACTSGNLNAVSFVACV